MGADLEYALYLVGQGYYIFPIPANQKRPILHWRDDSTRNEERIRNWFIDPVTGWPQNINIGIDMGKSGLLGVDVDCKAGKQGLETFERLKKEHGWPRTMVVRTPSGGFHLYYRATDFGNTVEHLGPGIDTRGEGGYLLAATSYVIDEEKGYEGPYVVEQDLPPAPHPAWLAEKLNASRVSLRQERTGAVYSEDHTDDIAWATDFLQHHAAAVEGSGGDNHTYITFCMLKERGLSITTAIDLVQEHWNPRCQPPWDLDGLEAKAQSAYATSRNATGVKSAHVEFDSTPVPNAPAAAAPPPARILHADNTRFNLADIPHRDWLYGNLALRGYLTVLVAQPGASKSTLAMEIAVSKAVDNPILGIPTRGRGRVAYVNNEDDVKEMQRRLGAAMQGFGIKTQELFEADVAGLAAAPFLYLHGSDSPQRFRIAKREGKADRIKPERVEELIAELIAARIDILVVDPYAETHPASENSNEESLEVAAIYRYVAQRAGIAIILVHHTRKHSNASSEGHSGNLDSIRGASSLGGAARIVVTLDSMNAKDAKRIGMPERERWRYVLLEGAKANFAPGDVNRMWFRRDSVMINPTIDNPDGESVGILRPVTLKEEFDMKPETRILLEDIEQVCADNPVLVSEIARELSTAFAGHAGKNPRTIERSIHRLFDGALVLDSVNGTLEFIEQMVGHRPAKAIRFTLTAETRRSIDELL